MARHDILRLGNDDEKGRCDARTCKDWLTCTLSKSCQRGRGRELEAPIVELLIERESGQILLCCTSYEERVSAKRKAK